MPDLIAQIARYALLAIFALGVVASLLRPRPVIENYEMLRLPQWFAFVTAATEAVAVALLIPLATVAWGALLAAVTMGVAALLTLRVKSYAHVVSPVVTMVLAIWVTRLFLPYVGPL